MSLSAKQTRTIAWVCIAVITLVTGFGQALHSVVGINHSCHCASAVDANERHACGDGSCPFLDSTSDAPPHTDEPTPVSPDSCSVCRLLAHVSNGVFDNPVVDGEQQPATRQLVFHIQLETFVSYFDHAPRGPPCTL